MARRVRFSEPALKWIEREAGRIAQDFGAVPAQEFRDRILKAVEAVAAFPGVAKRGKIPGSRTMVVHKRTVLTFVERGETLVVAAARSHWQGDAFEPDEAASPPTDEADGDHKH